MIARTTAPNQKNEVEETLRLTTARNAKMEEKIASLEKEAESLRVLLNQVPPLSPPIIEVEVSMVLPPRKRIRKMIQEKNSVNNMMLLSPPPQVPIELQRHPSWNPLNAPSSSELQNLQQLDSFTFQNGNSSSLRSVAEDIVSMHFDIGDIEMGASDGAGVMGGAVGSGTSQDMQYNQYLEDQFQETYERLKV